MKTRLALLFALSCSLLTLVGLVPCGADGAKPDDLSTEERREQYVRRCIKKGDFAHLNGMVLDAGFVARLIDGTIKDVPITRYGIRIDSATFDQCLEIENAEVTPVVWFDHCHFNKGIDFADSHFHRSLFIDGSTFGDADSQYSSARCYRMKIDGSLFLNGAVFANAVNFVDAVISGRLEAEGTQFNSPSMQVDFEKLKVGNHMLLTDAAFAGPVSFIDAEISGEFDARRAHFNSSFDNDTSLVDFSGIKVSTNMWLTDAVFAGPVSFLDAAISGRFEAEGTQFNNPSMKVNFEKLKVGSHMLLRDAVFAGPVSFLDAVISSQLVAESAHFNNPTETVNFEKLKVGSHMLLNHATFAGPAYFFNADVSGLFMAENATFDYHLGTANADADVDFEGLKVGSNMDLTGAQFCGRVDFTRADIAGDLNATRSQFRYSGHWSDAVPPDVDFSDVKVGSEAKFSDTQFVGDLQLGGMSYQHISRTLDNGKALWHNMENVLDLANRSDYNEETYTTLEGYFQREGYPTLASQTFVDGQWRETWEAAPWYSTWWRFLLWLSVGYGRRPEWAAGWSLIFIVFGWVLYRKVDDMETKKKEDEGRYDYSGFWYSLSLFLPIVSLETSSIWRPKYDDPNLPYRLPHRWWRLFFPWDDHFLRFKHIDHEKWQWWRLVYMRIHILLGWILVPIGLAALTGLIK